MGELAEVVSLDEERSMKARDRFIAAVNAQQRSSVELMDAALDAYEAKAWLTDDDFRAELGAGRISYTRDDETRSAFVAWVQFRCSEVKQSYAYQLLNSARARAMLSAPTAVGALPSTEYATRPLTKLLNVRTLKSESYDEAEHHAAAAAVWQDALEHEPTPVAAAKNITKYIKRSDYAPLRRAAGPKSPRQRGEERRARAAKAAKEFTASGYELMRLGAIDKFDAALTELQEARARWTP